MVALHDLARDETVDTETRRTAAEALTRAGAFRRPRVGPARSFLWLLGLTLVIVAAAAVDTIGAVGAVVLFVAGMVGLVLYNRHAVRREQAGGTYIAPDGETIELEDGAGG